MATFLFVEDNPFDQTVYYQFAKDSELVEDYNLASSVKEAIEFLNHTSYDLIITDYDLGDGNALNFMEIVENCPVIMVTGKGNEEIAASAYRNGVYDYIIKDKGHNYIKKLHLVAQNALELASLKSELYEKDKKYRLLVEYANEIIYLTDGHGYITFINEHGCSILGYSPDQVIGKHYTSLLHEEYVTTAIEFYKDRYLNQVENTYLELPFLTKDGVPIWFGQKVRDLYRNGKNISENISGYMAFGRDITDRIESNKQIKHQNLELEQKNQEISATLDQLVKAKASKTANAIVLILAIILFVFSEGLLEPIVDRFTQNQNSGFFIKGFIALSLKPLDIGVERILMKRNLRRLKRGKGSPDVFLNKRNWILRFMNLD